MHEEHLSPPRTSPGEVSPARSVSPGSILEIPINVQHRYPVFPGSTATLPDDISSSLHPSTDDATDRSAVPADTPQQLAHMPLNNDTNLRASDPDGGIELDLFHSPSPAVPQRVFRHGRYLEEMQREDLGNPIPEQLDNFITQNRRAMFEEEDSGFGTRQPRGRSRRRRFDDDSYLSQRSMRSLAETRAEDERIRNERRRQDSPVPGSRRNDGWVLQNVPAEETPAYYFDPRADGNRLVGAVNSNNGTPRPRRATSPFPLLAPPPTIPVQRRDRAHTTPEHRYRGPSPLHHVQNQASIATEVSVGPALFFTAGDPATRDIDPLLEMYRAEMRRRVIDRLQSNTPQAPNAQTVPKWYVGWKGRSVVVAVLAIIIIIIIASTAGKLTA
jgi:hypothetical protein